MPTKPQTVAMVAVVVVIVGWASPVVASGGAQTNVVRSETGQLQGPPTPDSTPPGNNGTTPDNQTTPPGNQTTPPGNQTTPPGNQTTPPGNQTTPPGNRTDNVTRGPVQGLPEGVESFQSTRPLTGTQTNPPSLAGKIRVEQQYRAKTSIDLVRNNSTEYELAITVTGNATNVSFYLQSQAVAASQNISNVTASVDGQPIAFGTRQAANSGWIAFEVDHFSTRHVSFQSSGGTDGSPLEGPAGQYDQDGNGDIDIGELGDAAAAMATGDITISELAAVARAFATG